MATFYYQAADPSGRVSSGSLEAGSPEAVADKLNQQGLVPIRVGLRDTSEQFSLSLGWRFRRHGSLSDLAVFARLLSTLLDAGIPLLEALQALARQQTKSSLRNIITGLYQQVESGQRLSTACAAYPEFFPPIYVSMLKAGEATGEMSAILERLAAFSEYELEIRSKVWSSLRYPMVVVTAAVIAFFGIVLFVIPKFALLFANFKARLPWPTRLVLGISQFIRSYFLVLALVFGLAVLFAAGALRSSLNRRLWDRFKLNIPAFGTLFLRMDLAKFCRSLGALLSSGLEILPSLELTAATLRNSYISYEISQRTKNDLIAGKRLSSSLDNLGFFPPMIVQMVSAGEKSGKLEELLTKAADSLDQQVDNAIKGLVSMIEPAMVLLLGIGILIMALAIFLPVWEMVTFVKQ